MLNPWTACESAAITYGVEASGGRHYWEVKVNGVNVQNGFADTNNKAWDAAVSSACHTSIIIDTFVNTSR